MREYLRQWPWLFCVPLCAALGVFLTAGCSVRLPLPAAFPMA